MSESDKGRSRYHLNNNLFSHQQTVHFTLVNLRYPTHLSIPVLCSHHLKRLGLDFTRGVRRRKLSGCEIFPEPPRRTVRCRRETGSVAGSVLLENYGAREESRHLVGAGNMLVRVQALTEE
jgi:hypothetical protein